MQNLNDKKDNISVMGINLDIKYVDLKKKKKKRGGGGAHSKFNAFLERNSG